MRSPVQDGMVNPSAKAGSSQRTATVTTSRLEVDDDVSRAVVERWLASNNEQFGTALSLSYDQTVPYEAVPGDAFQNLLHERALVSQVTYDEVEDVRSFGLEIKAGLEFGVSVDMEERTSRADAAQYLSAIRPNGRRVVVEDAGCR
ncbi:MAG: hypothetical protein ACR2MA_00080 [Egibacteraceae bacterium]